MEHRDIIITEYVGREAYDKFLTIKSPELWKYYSETFLKRPQGKCCREQDKRTPDEKAAAINGALYTDGVPEKNDIYCSHVGRGGVLCALWDMSKELNCGLNVDLLKIPFRQEVIELCEYLELNPYELESGKEVRLIAAPEGTFLCDKLSECGIDASIVGYTIPGKQKLLRIHDRVRYLDRPNVSQ